MTVTSLGRRASPRRWGLPGEKRRGERRGGKGRGVVVGVSTAVTWFFPKQQVPSN